MKKYSLKEIEEIMGNRGFRHTMTINQNIYCFSNFNFENLDAPTIYCKVYSENNTFEIYYVTKNFLTVQSNPLGSFDDDEHFNRFFKKVYNVALLIKKGEKYTTNIRIQ